MSNFLILGDSWGEPPWRHPAINYTYENHFSVLLRKKYKVLNFSSAGYGNRFSMDYVNWWIKSNYSLDDLYNSYIVWCNSEVLRDVDLQGVKSIKEVDQKIQEEAESQYRQITNIAKQLKCKKILIIEGEAPLVQEKENFIDYEKSILRNCRSFISDQVFPQTNYGELALAIKANITKIPCLPNDIKNDLYSINRQMSARPDVFSEDHHPNDSSSKKIYNWIIDNA